jgi:hypothetical protein
MSTLQHIAQPALRTRVVLAVVLAGAIAAVMVVLIASSGGTSDSLTAPSGALPHPGKAQIERQLESVAGPRYQAPFPTNRPAPRTQPAQSPQRQLEAVSPERYLQQLALRKDRR